MTSTASLPRDEFWTPAAFVVGGSRGDHGEHEHTVSFSPGARLTWDPSLSRGWRQISVGHWTQETELLVRHVVGTSPTREPADDAGHQPSRHSPWHRLAAVETLNRWLHLPLDESLVLAERAVARLAAAATLPRGGPIRQRLVHRATQLAQQASPGLKPYVVRLLDGPPVPDLLAKAIGRLAEGYTALVQENKDVDSELYEVIEPWRQYVVDGRTPMRLPATDVWLPTASGADGGDGWAAGGGFLDPRLLDARVVRLADDPEEPDVAVDDVGLGGEPVVRVQVRAGGVAVPPGVLWARLVARTRPVDAYGILRAPTAEDSRTADAGRCYEVDVPLGERSLEGIRVDVFDRRKEHERPPAPSDDDPGLRRSRRAAVFLREWRRLAADVRFATADSAGSRLQRVVDLVSGSAPEPKSRPLWACGPSRADLQRLLGLREETMRAVLRGDVATSAVPRLRQHPRCASVAGLTSGPNGLLVAELAAAYARSLDAP